MPPTSPTRSAAKPLPLGSNAKGPPCLIGLAGPSGAGKTTLARSLQTHLPGPATVLSLDAYYRDLAALSPVARARVNFDAPEAMDHQRLAADLRQLAAGHRVEIPVYDFATHTRQATQHRLTPTDFLIVEGLFALYWPDINARYHLRLFVAADDALCLERRLARDRVKRGRSPASIRAQYQEQVRPMYRRHIQPTARYADLILDGSTPTEEQVATVLDSL